MDYSREALDSNRYLTMKGALEFSGLTAAELKRAIALGFVITAEIGTTTFVERHSLGTYVETSTAGEQAQLTRGSLVSPYVPGQFRAKDDNHIDPKERTVFTEALERDRGVASRLSVAPYVSVAVLALFALILSFPVPQTENREALSEAGAFFTRASIKEATLDKVNALLVYTSETSAGFAREMRGSGAEAASPYPASLELQTANALSTLVDSISGAIDTLALEVYTTINSLLSGGADL